MRIRLVIKAESIDAISSAQSTVAVPVIPLDPHRLYQQKITMRQHHQHRPSSPTNVRHSIRLRALKLDAPAVAKEARISLPDGG